MWIYSLLFVSFIHSQEVNDSVDVANVSSDSLAENLEGEEKDWTFFGELTLESKQQNLSEQRPSTDSGVQNLSVGLEYQFTRNLKSRFEILGQQGIEDTEIYLGEVYFDYSPDFLSAFNFMAGNMYYSYGVLTGAEGVYSRRPSYYSDLLVTRRGIDLGAKVKYQPLEGIPLSASYSYFSGRTLRTGDNSLENAEINPQFLSLDYKPSFLQARLVYLTRRYQRRPQFEGIGLELQSSTFKFWKDRFRASALSEFWNLSYERQDGLERVGQALSYGGYFEFFYVFYRGLFSQERWESPGTSPYQANFRLHGMGLRINDHIFLEYQNIHADETQSSFSLDRVSEENWRIFLVF